MKRSYAQYLEEEFDIDWDEIIAECDQPIDPADCMSPEVAREFTARVIEEIWEEVVREQEAAVRSLDVAR